MGWSIPSATVCRGADDGRAGRHAEPGRDGALEWDGLTDNYCAALLLAALACTTSSPPSAWSPTHRTAWWVSYPNTPQCRLNLPV